MCSSMVCTCEVCGVRWLATTDALSGRCDVLIQGLHLLRCRAEEACSGQCCTGLTHLAGYGLVSAAARGVGGETLMRSAVDVMFSPLVCICQVQSTREIVRSMPPIPPFNHSPPSCQSQPLIPLPLILLSTLLLPSHHAAVLPSCVTNLATHSHASPALPGLISASHPALQSFATCLLPSPRTHSCPPLPVTNVPTHSHASPAPPGR